MNFNKFLFELRDDLSFIQKFSERQEMLFGEFFEDITYLPYEVLKNEIPELIKESKYEHAIYEVVRFKKKNITFKRVKKLDNYTKLKFFFHIEDQYKKIKELEATYLSTPPDPKLINAGIQELDVLGDTNLIDTLANGDILKWNEVRKLPYAMIFDKQLKSTIEARINRKLTKKNGYS